MGKTFFEPRISCDTAAFWNGCREHKLVMQQCNCCGTLRWPAGVLCPKCLSDDTRLKEISQQGTVYSYVVFRKAFHPSLQDKLPYIVATIDLDDGVRLVSNIVNCEVDKIKCGDRVEAVWENELPVPNFKRLG